jgi:hypothetical protein
MILDHDTAADELADLRSEAQWLRQRHRKLMNLPVGHPDEPDHEDKADEE